MPTAQDGKSRRAVGEHRLEEIGRLRIASEPVLRLGQRDLALPDHRWHIMPEHGAVEGMFAGEAAYEGAWDLLLGDRVRRRQPFEPAALRFRLPAGQAAGAERLLQSSHGKGVAPTRHDGDAELPGDEGAFGPDPVCLREMSKGLELGLRGAAVAPR